ncbi:glycosyltransferase [Streptomyces lavendulae]|uniref:glycosyltransferase n=1 Tax=Streptomyces lavendulae TaxID=1914 RepID=UPI0034001508
MCLHLRGHSILKNTPAVLEAWRRNSDLPLLTVISQIDFPHPPPGVTVLGRLPFEELKQHINRHQIHVCPSRAEGWGHYITEGLSVGAAVITTDAPP